MNKKFYFIANQQSIKEKCCLCGGRVGKCVHTKISFPKLEDQWKLDLSLDYGLKVSRSSISCITPTFS
jgi:hypothetical protein